jgi:hypothetical protein
LPNRKQSLATPKKKKKKVRWRRDMIDKQAQMVGMMGMERPVFSNKSAKEIKVGALWADGMGFQKVNIVLCNVGGGARRARALVVGGKLADWTEGWIRDDMLGVVADQQVCVETCGGSLC